MKEWYIDPRERLQSHSKREISGINTGSAQEKEAAGYTMIFTKKTENRGIHSERRKISQDKSKSREREEDTDTGTESFSLIY